MKEDLPKDQTKYLLLLVMLRQAEEEDQQSKRCQGAYETLEFGQSVSSATSKMCYDLASCTELTGGFVKKSNKTLKKNKKIKKKKSKKKYYLYKINKTKRRNKKMIN